jgi:hypothetical protein
LFTAPLQVWLTDDATFAVPPTTVYAVKDDEQAALMAAVQGGPLGGTCWPRGNSKEGKSWLDRDIFRKSLRALRKYRDEYHRDHGVYKVLVVFCDHHTIHDLEATDDGAAFLANELEARDIYYFMLPAKLTWILQPVDVSGVIRTIKSRLRREGWRRPFFLPEFWEAYAEAVAEYSTPETFRRLGLVAEDVPREELAANVAGAFVAAEGGDAA